MRTTVTIDDNVLETARNYSGIEDVPTLIREALKTLISLEAAQRLAALGGSQLDAEAAPRRRPWLEVEDDVA